MNKYRIGEEWIELSELDSAVDKIFGSDRATAVVDQEESKLYLATWGEPSEVKEKLFGQWLDKKYNYINLIFIPIYYKNIQF